MNTTVQLFPEVFPEFDHGLTYRHSGHRVLPVILLSLALHLFVLNYVTDMDGFLTADKPLSIFTPLSVIIEEPSPSIDTKGETALDADPAAIQSEADENVIHTSAKPETVNSASPAANINNDNSEPPPLPQTETRTRLSAKDLIAISKQAAETAAKNMESLLGSIKIFNPRFRKQLEKAHLIQNKRGIEQTDSSDIEGTFYNSMGDTIIISGGNCFRIPGLFLLDTFKDLNSIIAMPDPSCSKHENKTFSLTDE